MKADPYASEQFDQPSSVGVAQDVKAAKISGMLHIPAVQSCTASCTQAGHKGSTLEGSTLGGSTLEDSAFGGSTLEGSILEGSTLEGSTHQGSTRKGSTSRAELASWPVSQPLSPTSHPATPAGLTAPGFGSLAHSTHESSPAEPNAITASELASLTHNTLECGSAELDSAFGNVAEATPAGCSDQPQVVHARPNDLSPIIFTDTLQARRVSRSPDVGLNKEEAAARRIQNWWRDYRRKQDIEGRKFCRYGKLAQHIVQRWVSGEWELEPPFLSSSRLVLHFDINKTVLMSDRVQDASTEHIVNMLLAECAWGRLEPGPCWRPVGRLATDRPTADPELMTYRVFLDSFLLPFKSGACPDVERYNSKVKAQRQHLKRVFTEEQQPGRMFRGVFKELRQALRLSEAEKQAAHSSPLASQLFQAGERRLLPSFFHLLLHLQRQGQPFCLVFRTFGSDINEVMEEVNLFATGQHPSFPGVRMDGSDGMTDVRLTPATCGAFVRTSGRADGTVLCWPAGPHLLAAKQHTMEQVLQEVHAGRAQLVQGMQSIYSHMKDLTLAPGNRAIAIRDFYPFWKIQNERSRAGKLLLLEEDNPSCIHIFFDDNIGYGSAHIVDARDPHTAEALPFVPLFNKHLVKAEPLNAILDNKYFIRMVSTCEMEVLQGRSLKRILQRLSNLDGRGQRPAAGAEWASGGHLQRSCNCNSTGEGGHRLLSSLGSATSASSTSPGVGSDSLQHAQRRSTHVARTSLSARLRWDSVTHRVRLMVRVLLYLKGQ